MTTTPQLPAATGETPVTEIGLEPTNPIHFQVLDSLGKLEQMLLTRDPLMKTHLANVHKHLIGYEELTHLLKPEQVRTIVQAQMQLTQTVVATVAQSKAKTSEAAKLRKLTMDDI